MAPPGSTVIPEVMVLVGSVDAEAQFGGFRAVGSSSVDNIERLAHDVDAMSVGRFLSFTASGKTPKNNLRGRIAVRKRTSNRNPKRFRTSETGVFPQLPRHLGFSRPGCRMLRDRLRTVQHHS